eukprot:30667-Pelagococcus_subviridis.AAC.4
MATRFLADVGSKVPISQVIVWRIEDNATIQLKLARALTENNIAVVGHSIVRSRVPYLQHYMTFVPNFHFIETRGFVNILKKIREKGIRFEKRIPQVMWAGSDTGIPCDGERPCSNSCDDRKRIKLVRNFQGFSWLNLTLTSPHIKGQGVVNCNCSVQKQISEESWAGYRGILDIDGSVDAWGSRWRLESGSVLFQVRSSFESHFSARLVNGVHYVLLSANLSDLVGKTTIITSNEQRDIGYLTTLATNARGVLKTISYDDAVQEVGIKLRKYQHSKFEHSKHDPLRARGENRVAGLNAGIGAAPRHRAAVMTRTKRQNERERGRPRVPLDAMKFKRRCHNTSTVVYKGVPHDIL